MTTSPRRLFFVVVLAMVAGAAATWFFLQPPDPEQGPQKGDDNEPSLETIAPVSSANSNEEESPTPSAVEAPKERPQPLVTTPDLPRIAIIIDDVGLRRDVLDPFWSIPQVHGRLSWAVIPGAKFSNEITRSLARKTECILAHIPMEPSDRNQVTPSLGTYLLSTDTDAGLRQKLNQRMNTFPTELRPAITGLSNHQGSLFTTNEKGMRTVLSYVAAQNLFFVDSRTASNTVGTTLAKKMGVPVAERQVFLDNKRDVSAIEVQLQELLTIAKRDGQSVGIGHPYAETAMALARWLARHEGEFVLVPIHLLLSKS